MKTLAQSKRNCPVATPARRPQRRTACRDTHERQAAFVAGRFMRGHERLAPFVTAAPTAGFVLPQSPGIPLPPALRAELEQSFGADLGAVRIHHDVHATAAARDAGAAAFASGTHLYFRAGAFDAQSESGRTLLAHEVTHVLQQTGRAGSGGMVRAVDRRGLGDVQNWDSPLDSTVAVAEISELLAAHRDALEPAAPERATIERLRQTYSAANVAGQASAYVDARVLHVTNDDVDPVLGGKPSAVAAPVASALYDLLKRGYVWGSAAQLLHMRRDLKTRFFSAETYRSYMDNYGGPDFAVAKARFYHHWFSGPWFGRANPRFMLDRVQILLLGPSTTKLSKQEVANGQLLVNAYQAELKRVDSGDLLPDELYFVTVKVAADIERLQLLLFELLLAQVRRFPNFDEATRARVKLTVARQLRVGIRAVQADREKMLAPTMIANRGDYSRESLLLYLDDVLPVLNQMAEYAIAYWESVEPFGQSLVDGKPIPGTTQTALQALQSLDKELPRYRAMLDTFLHALLDRNPDGTLPAPAAFAARRDAAIKTLDAEMWRLVDRPLADRVFDALPDARQPGFSFDRSIADRRLPLGTRALIAWAQTLATQLRLEAAGYSPTKDEALGRRAAGSVSAGDLRLMLRVRLARTMLEIGSLAGWKAWVDWARPILEGREPVAGRPMEEDYIAFGTDWELDSDAAPSLMAYDLPNEVPGFAPLRTRDLVEFYMTVDYATMSRHINRQLALREKKYDLKAVPVLNQALKDARAERHPERYLVRTWEWVRPWEETKAGPVPKPRQDFHELLRNHPLTKVLRAEAKARDGEESAWGVNGTLVEGKEALALWLAPTPVQLVERVQAIPAVNRALLAALPRGLVVDPKDTPERKAEVARLRTDIESGKAYRDAGSSTAPAPVPLDKLTVPLLQALQPMEWWALWLAVLGGFRGAERERLLDLMRQGVVGAALPAQLAHERQQAFEQLRRDERLAVAHQRRTIVDKQLRPVLRNFERYSWDEYQVPGGKRVLKRRLARETVDLLRKFLIHVPEQEERDGHQAMALLEMSDVIRDKLVGLSDIDEFYPWAPLIDDALFWCSDPLLGGNPVARDSFTVPEEQGNVALFEERRARLLGVLTHIAEQFQRYFQKWGLVATKGDGTIENPGSVHAVGESRHLGRGTVFANAGHTYEIIQVHKSFVFHPGAVHFRSLPPAATGGSRLSIEGGEFLAEGKGQRPHELLMHVIVDGDVEATAVYADDDPRLLAQITWALHMHAILAQLTALAQAMETFAELIVDLAELFPVAGQAIAAARLVTSAMILIASDLPKMVKHLIENPRALIDQVWGRLQGLLSLGNLLDYLLFSNHSLNGLIREKPAGTDRNPGGSSSRRMKRLIHKLQNFARGVGRVLVRMQRGVQIRRQGVEHFVQASPGVVRVIQLIADYYFVLTSLAEHLAEMKDRDEAIREFNSAKGSLPTYIDELVASVGRIELPEEILPLNMLVDTLIDVVGHRLGGKYKLGVKILLKLLEAVGARDDVVDGIVAVLRNAGVKTDNVFPAWRRDIIPGIKGHLQTAQTQFRDTVDSAFGTFGAPLGLAAPKPEVILEGTEFPDPPADLPAGGQEVPETQPRLEDAVRMGVQRRQAGAGMDPVRATALLRAIPGEAGESLPVSVRARAEKRFGQDFSHVRLHRGARAAGLARSVGARALTTGSHIVMGEGGRADQRLLYHELAHVVQQTGRRPAGAKRTARPRPGRPGRGLRVDTRAEARADTAAAAALRGSARGVDLGAAAEGLQPSLIEMLGQRFLRQITDITALEAEVAEIEKTGTRTGLRLIGRDVRKAVSGVADNLRANFEPGRDALHAATRGPYAKKLEAISSHLKNFRPEIEGAIEDIAIKASYEAERGKKGKPARMALDTRDFKRRLERFIFGKTGILLELTAEIHRLTKQFKNEKAPFSKAEVKFVFLAPIHGNAQLWQDALEKRSYPGGVPPKKIPEDDRPAWRTRIRSVLRQVGPSSSIWISDEYRLSAKVFEAAEELERRYQTGALTGTLPPGELLTVGEYVDTAAYGDKGFGNLRLHLGIYDQKKKEQRGKERESHHTTQYLLSAYFYNGPSDALEKDSERKGFPLLPKHRDAYGSKMQLTASGRPKIFSGIKLQELEEHRGGKMPTILIARGTHRHGHLHLTPQGDDFDDTTTATQAAAMNHVYKSALPPKQRELEREVAGDAKSYKDWEKYTATHDVGDAVEDAMQATYAQLRKYMQKQLRVGLIGIERDYYNDVYVAGHKQSKTQPLTRDAMNKVATKAATHNDAVMKAFGWTA